MSIRDDLGLTIPLRGVQLIEASAGTGKTFTLATVYARLVIECGMDVSSLLVVTFTDAATKELRKRLRDRLVLASRVSEGEPTDEADEEHRLTATLVHAAIEREGGPSLRRRLRVACEAMDLAPIHTIHGFCRRALADHALEAGQALLDRVLIENEKTLRIEVATDFWRDASYGSDASALSALWKSPERLADSLRELLALDTLLPMPAAPDNDSEARLQAECVELAAAFATHGEHARAQLRQAFAEEVIHKTYSKDEAVDPVWQALASWSSQLERRDRIHDKLKNYGSSALRKYANSDRKTKQKKVTPDSPLFEAIDAWCAARQACDAVQRQRQVALVHRARDYASQRLLALKTERGLIGYDDMIRGVADALSASDGDRFAERLQTQYRFALLDEFQDTDSRQWTIFCRLFATDDSEDGVKPRGLILIGDPKQAIYRFRGGDVYTYLAAANTADARHALTRNFRSRPAMLRAVQALFELSGADAFAQPGIDFVPIDADGRRADTHFLRNDVVAPALTVLRLPCPERLTADAARELAATACVTEIHALLADGVVGRAVLTDRRGTVRAVMPGDLAVLVESNKDAQRMQDALSLAGIPCVAAGRQSLYQSDEAEQLRWLLEALLAPADDGRLRAALATPLLGLDAAAIAALDQDEHAHRHWQDRLHSWRSLAERHGVLALVNELCAENAPRLLGLIDGERRVSNALQLAEALQADAAQGPGLAGVLTALERRIAEADAHNDAELLRLESDAARVKILTMHKSKGLEFEFVFLPFAATSGAARPKSSPAIAQYHDGTQRIAMLFPEPGDGAAAKENAEERAEDLRLLYVGLTRARLATWLAWGSVNNVENTPMAWLLHRPPGAGAPEGIDEAGIRQRLSCLQEKAPAAIEIVDATWSLPTARLRFAGEQPSPAPAVAARTLSRDWWVHSFSQLTREDDGREQGGAGDEIEPAVPIAPSRFSGARFGNSLHAALERVRFEAWRDCRDDAAPDGEIDALAEALRGEAYVSQADQDEGVPLLARLIRHTLTVRLPEGGCLADLPVSMRRSEMEFHFSLRSTPLDALLSLLRKHGLLHGRDRFGQRARIEGLMTGKIDLVYERAGRFYLLDYKSNQLSGYGADALVAAMHDHEYTLQYLIYTLTLHRWLRFRLGAGYDYDEHFGGVRYMFCRGLDAARDDSPGLHAVRPARALIDALDALLAPVVADAPA